MVNRDTILLACGTIKSRATIRVLFENRYHFLEASNTSQAMLLLQQSEAYIAAVIVDTTNCEQACTHFLEAVSQNPTLSKIPVIAILSANSTLEEWHAFELGASDVIVSPYDANSMRCRVQSIIARNLQHRHLEALVDKQADILDHSTQSMIDTLSSIIEHRNIESGTHIERIRHFTQILLEEVASSCPEYELTQDQIKIISSAAALHDVGKISIPDAILNKPGRLTPEERKIMEQHPVSGFHILTQLTGIGNEEYICYAQNICHYHHERWDGGGYPDGLVGDDIPICAQVVGLTDAYDALTNKRVYKEAFSHAKSVNMILNGECGAFSQKLLACFKQVGDQFAALVENYENGRSPKADNVPLVLAPPTGKAEAATLHLMQAKYQAILQLMDATVIEVNPDLSTFHVVYNPDPNLAILNTLSTWEDIQEILPEHIPDPQEKDLILSLMNKDTSVFLKNHTRCQYFNLKIHSKVNRAPIPYKMALHRVEPSTSSSLRFIAVFQKEATEAFAVSPDVLYNSVITDMLERLYVFQLDQWLTLIQTSKDMTSALGYTISELETKFQNRLINLVHPDDREKLLNSIDEQLSSGIEAVVEFRLLHKDGHYVWILSKNRIFTNSDGLACLYGGMINVSKNKSVEEELRLILERHEIILSQTENIVFEYDLIKKKAYFPKKWKEFFGYEPIITTLEDFVPKYSHIHPEDIPEVLDKLKKLYYESNYEEFQCRISKADGRYMWCLIRVTVQYDSNQKPCKFVCILFNVDDKKRAAQALKDKAEQDSLTGLLNKAAGKSHIEAYLAMTNERESSALILIDLDNFKLVNDYYGHMFGDAILSQASKEIEKQFRTNDIISRIGGDEFLVFMKDIPSPSLVEDRVKHLTSIFRTIFQDRVPDTNLSCSIGVAVYPQHGVSYNDLFQHADQALYHVKAKNKDAYMIYDEHMSSFLNRATPNARARSPIDSVSETSLSYDTLARYAFHQLYDSGDVTMTVNNMLDLVGRQLNVSRVYIFENDHDNTSCSNTFEWCNTGVSPQINNLQNINYLTDIPGYKDNFNEQGIFYCPDITTLSKPIYEVLAPQRIKSILQCAIQDRGTNRGFVGFDECSSNRLWTQDQIDALQVFSGLLSVFLLKQRAQDEITSRVKDLMSILDNQDAWIYVIDQETFQIRFLNAKIRSIVPSVAEGAYCYESLAGKREQCEQCPIRNMHRDLNSGGIVDAGKYFPRTYCEACRIQWDGHDAYMLTCRKMKNKHGEDV